MAVIRLQHIAVYTYTEPVNEIDIVGEGGAVCGGSGIVALVTAVIGEGGSVCGGFSTFNLTTSGDVVFVSSPVYTPFVRSEKHISFVRNEV